LSKEPNASEPLIALAKSLLRAGQPEQALARVRVVTEATSDHHLAHNLEGEVLAISGELDAAEAAFERAIELQPTWVDPYRNLARVALVRKDDEMALAAMQRGYEKTRSVQLGIELAVKLDNAGESARARAIYEELLVAHPDDLNVANNFAMSLISGEPDQADLDRALELTERFSLQHNPVFLDTLGWVHFKRNDLQNALRLLERAARGGSNLAEIDYHLAEVYAALGRIDEAKNLLLEVQKSSQTFVGRDRAEQLLASLQGD